MLLEYIWTILKLLQRVLFNKLAAYFLGTSMYYMKKISLVLFIELFNPLAYNHESDSW